MKQKIIFLILVKSMMLSQLNAQAPTPEDILRSSSFQPIEPTTASLGKYGEYQMDYSNGLPDISIPLYEIKSGDITVPIVLRYQGGGIKVQQEATWVGLGWDLFYGGQVTRVVQGFSDEKEPDQSQRPTANQIRSYMAQHNSEANNSYLKNLADNKSSAYSFMPDEFYYNVGMESGKFIGEKVEALVPYKPIKIQGSTSGWSITDSESITYSFKKNETTSTLSADHVLPSYTSAWGVDKITSPGNHTVSYEYQTDGYYVFNHSQSYEGYSYSYLDIDVPWYREFDINKNNIITLKKSPVRLKVESKKPRYIYFDGGRVQFVLSPRSDIKNNDNSTPIQKLEMIVIERLRPNGSYEGIKYIQFSYSYKDNRLFLNGVDEYSFSPSASKRIAKFEYDSTPLPDKNSYSYDYCGYYNGSNNTTPIPRYNIVTNYGLISLGGANKNVVESFTKAGILTAIEYPTKGKTSFTWENHHYGSDQSIYKGQYTTWESVNVAGNTKKTCSNTKPDPNDEGNFVSFTNYIDQTIRITGKIERINMVDFQHEKYDKGAITFTDLTSGRVLLNKPLVKSSTSIDEVLQLISNHTYRIAVTTNCTNIRAYIGFQYNKYDPNKDKYNYSYGGLRIKEIANYDTDGKLLDKSSFTYTDPDNANKSSGYVTNVADILLSKHSKIAECIPCETCGVRSLENVYKYTETSLYYDNPLTGIYSNNLSYQYVQVQKLSSDNKNNGIIKYEFKTYLDDQLNSDLPVISNSGLRGQLLKESIYNDKNDLLSQTINYYSNHSKIKTSSSGIKVVQGINLLTGLCKMSDKAIFDLAHLYIPYDYTYYSYWCKMDSTLKYDFYGSNKILQKTEYVYDNIVACLPTKITTTLNNDKKQVVSITYPLERTKELSFETKEEKIDNTLIYKQTNKYSRILSGTPTTGRFLISLDSVRINYGTGVEETQVKMKHDTKNNIIELISLSATPVIYLWSYSYQYPIAEIKNTTYADVCKKLGGNNEQTGKAWLETVANKVEPSSSDFTTINNLRKLLPNVMITTYTYKSLVGIESMTNPSGIKTTYFYDAFNRLQYIKDMDDKIVESYDYHYKN